VDFSGFKIVENREFCKCINILKQYFDKKARRGKSWAWQMQQYQSDNEESLCGFTCNTNNTVKQDVPFV
jgi:hypothetical protein